MPVSVFRHALLAACVLLGVSCGSVTEIVLVLDSDLPEGSVETFWIRVSGASARCVSVDASEAELPLTLGLVPSADEQQIEVTAAAFAPGVAVPECTTTAVDGALVAQRARVRFVRGERRVLFMTLESACRGVSCEEETSCREGTCRSVERTLDPWTGSLPRLTDAGVHDAGVDAGAGDAGADGGTDAGPADAAAPDGGTDAGDPGPCGGAEPLTYLAEASADTALFSGVCSTACGGSNDGGALELLNIGFGRVILRFLLPADLSVTDIGERLVDARVLLTRVRDHSACTGCAFDGTLEARPMRNQWTEGTGAGYTGADWCRRDTDTPCNRWSIPGADQVGVDVASTYMDVFVSADRDTAELPLRVNDIAAFAEDRDLSVQLRGARSGAGDPMQVVFVTSSIEGKAAFGGVPARLALTYCP